MPEIKFVWKNESKIFILSFVIFFSFQNRRRRMI